MQDKLYVCLDDNNRLSLQTRYTLDAMIADAEESDNSLSMTAVGTVKVPSEKTPFYIVAKMNTAVLYDVVEADSVEDAQKKFLGFKRFAGKNVVIQHTRDLTDIIKQYYE
jgi:hypothetical protein